MAVKFVRTCDRCGKVIREGNANSTLTVGEGNSLNFYTKDEHKSYDICDECAEAFEKFMTGWVSLRGALSEEKQYVDFDEGCLATNDTRYMNISQSGKLEPINATTKETKNDGPSDEVLAIMREHNAQCDAMEAESDKNAPIFKFASSHASKVSDSKITVVNDDDPHLEKNQIKLKPGTHTYHKWTKEDDDFILHHSLGWTIQQLAYKFGATVKATAEHKRLLLNGKIQPKE